MTTDPLKFGHTLAMLPKREFRQGCGSNECAGLVYTGKVLCALIPDEKLLPLIENLKQVDADMRDLATQRGRGRGQGDVQKSARDCEACNLCMVCAGLHRRYSREFHTHWPPGQSRCFVHLEKGGQPLRETACKLCDEHDKMSRDVERDKRRHISENSKLRTILENLQRERLRLFDEFAVDSHTFKR